MTFLITLNVPIFFDTPTFCIRTKLATILNRRTTHGTSGNAEYEYYKH